MIINQHHRVLDKSEDGYVRVCHPSFMMKREISVWDSPVLSMLHGNGHLLLVVLRMKKHIIPTLTVAEMVLVAHGEPVADSIFTMHRSAQLSYWAWANDERRLNLDLHLRDRIREIIDARMSNA